MKELSLDPARQEKAREYARLRWRLTLGELALGGCFLLFLLVSGLSLRLREYLDFPWPLGIALYIIVVMVGYGLLSLPLAFYGGFTLPRRYGLSTQGFRGWLADAAKASALSLVLGVVVMVAVYWLLAAAPETWWLWAAILLIVLSVVVTNLAPLLILPLFFKLRPLTDAELEARLRRLAERAGTRVGGVFTMDLSAKSTGANAALMGLGNTRRIVLTDTLFGRYSSEEIEVILAHELGHQVHHHIPKLIAVQSAVILVSFYLAGLALGWAVPRLGYRSIADAAAFPLLALALAVFALLVGPLLSAYSRRLERNADSFALALSRNPTAFVQMMTKLTDQNLSESQPSRWMKLFADHPSYLERVALARRYETDTSQGGASRSP